MHSSHVSAFLELQGVQDMDTCEPYEMHTTTLAPGQPSYPTVPQSLTRNSKNPCKEHTRPWHLIRSRTCTSRMYQRSSSCKARCARQGQDWTGKLTSPHFVQTLLAFHGQPLPCSAAALLPSSHHESHCGSLQRALHVAMCATMQASNSKPRTQYRKHIVAGVCLHLKN